MLSAFIRTFSIVSLLAICGCTKSGSSEGGGSGNDDGGGTGRSAPFSTSCGTVVGGELDNPVSAESGLSGGVTVVGANLVILHLPSGDQLIKLHGLGAPSQQYKITGSLNTLNQLAAEPGIFFPADEACLTTLPGGGVGAIGQVFTASGKSYSESLIESGYAEPQSDTCGGQLLSSCYDALQEEHEKKIAGELTAFLWKPISDSTGRLAVHSGPYDASVIVAGETGTNQGGGNGYGSLARFTKPGCAYGANVKVQVVNSSGIPYAVGGQTTLTIPNGCNRYCLQGGQLVQCSK